MANAGPETALRVDPESEGQRPRSGEGQNDRGAGRTLEQTRERELSLDIR
jgi:hypothetical protein